MSSVDEEADRNATIRHNCRRNEIRMGVTIGEVYLRAVRSVQQTASGSNGVHGGENEDQCGEEQVGADSHDLTRHKISCREPDALPTQGKAWRANTQSVNVGLARGQLHRLVRSFLAFACAPGALYRGRSC